jgi:hypothetical protein
MGLNLGKTLMLVGYFSSVQHDGQCRVLAEYAVPRKNSARRSFWNKSNSKLTIKSISVFPAYSLSLMGHEVSPVAESSQIPSINGRLFTRSQLVSVLYVAREGLGGTRLEDPSREFQPAHVLILLPEVSPYPLSRWRCLDVEDFGENPCR